MILLLRRAVRVVLLVIVVVPLVLALLLLEREPRVVREGPPDAAAAEAGRALADSLRPLLDAEAGITRWSAAEAEVDGALAAAGRVVPGLAGRAEVSAAAAGVEVSLAVPRVPVDLWLNLSLALGPSDEGLRVTEARVGRLPLPAGWVVPVAAFVLDRVLGDAVASRALADIEGVRIAPPRVAVALRADASARAEFADRVQARMRQLSGNADLDRVYVHLWTHDEANRRGELPRRGSALPWVRHAVREAIAYAEEPDVGEMKAALYALAIACGDTRFATLIGMSGERRSRCRRTTLGGREDLRQHFALSAGVAAASTGETVMGVGSLKELLDSNEGGSGFSFDDMAANLAGARFAEVFLERPRADWPAMLALIEDEGDILPPLEDLPSGLSEAEFRERFGDVDSPEFTALVAEIERRIEAMPLYGATPMN